MLALSRQSSAVSPALSGFDDVYGVNLDDDWDVNGGDGGPIFSDCCKELQSWFDCYCQLLLERGELDVPSSFGGLPDRFIVVAHTDGPLFTTPSSDIATPSVKTLRNRVAPL